MRYLILFLLLATPVEARVVAYSEPHAVAQGDSVDIKASWAGDVLVRLQRATGSTFLGSWTVPAATQTIPADGETHGYDWTTTIRIEAPQESGMYYVRIDPVGVSGETGYARFLVREQTPSKQILIIWQDTTEEAYNTGETGYSLYVGPDTLYASRIPRVSFNRPQNKGQGRGHMTNPRCITFHDWADQSLDAAWATMTDLHRDPVWAHQYPIWITMGHNEYASGQMFDAFETGDIIFMSGNEMWWEIEMDPDLRGFDCAKDPVVEWLWSLQGRTTNAIKGCSSAHPQSPASYLLSDSKTWTVLNEFHPVMGGINTINIDPGQPIDEVDGLEVLNSSVLATLPASTLGGLPAYATIVAFEMSGYKRVALPTRNWGWNINDFAHGQILLNAIMWMQSTTSVPEHVTPRMLFPNPTRGAVFVRGQAPIDVYDVQGRRRGSFPVTGGEIRVSSLAPGAYFTLQGRFVKVP